MKIAINFVFSSFYKMTPLNKVLFVQEYLYLPTPGLVLTGWMPLLKLVGIQQIVPGVYKVPSNLIFFPTPILKIFIFVFPLPHLIFYPTALVLQGRSFCFTFSFFHVIFFPTALIFPSPPHNLIFFPNKLDKLPPQGGGE